MKDKWRNCRYLVCRKYGLCSEELYGRTCTGVELGLRDDNTCLDCSNTTAGSGMHHSTDVSRTQSGGLDVSS